MFAVIMGIALITLTGCLPLYKAKETLHTVSTSASSHRAMPDYPDESSLGMALTFGDDVIGKTVVFTVKDFGITTNATGNYYDIQGNYRTNYISKDEPKDIKEGDELFVRITGEYEKDDVRFITYDHLEHFNLLTW
jgi:hypothetical protein